MLIQDLQKLKNPTKAKYQYNYFRCNGGYGDPNDKFLGIPVPMVRSTTKKYLDLALSDVSKLLKNSIHEVRFAALLILVNKYKSNPKQIVDFYLKHTRYINNWDLVDVSCYNILGDYTYTNGNSILLKLSDSTNLWEQRMSIVSTIIHIKNNDFTTILKLAKKFINHSHPLIHKAIGWMLRAVGDQNLTILTKYLDKNHHQMNRIEISYAIEHLKNRKKYLLSKKMSFN